MFPRLNSGGIRMGSYMTNLQSLPGASLSSLSDFGAIIAIIGFLRFSCGLLVRPC